jgi:transcriptional regulator with XRE-family HTH domain
MIMDDFADQTLALRIRAERRARRWPLERLAEASGVSRAMISKIERGEASPTAATLARLANGFGISLASLFAEAAPGGGPLSRRAGQREWTDPASGYRRRHVSPPAAAGHAEIVEVSFPAGARAVFDNAVAVPGLAQQVLVLDGSIRVAAGDMAADLEAGDCLFMPLDRPVTFGNGGAGPARYLVILSRRPA